jgi:hypothetical protein
LLDQVVNPKHDLLVDCDNDLGFAHSFSQYDAAPYRALRQQAFGRLPKSP